LQELGQFQQRNSYWAQPDLNEDPKTVAQRYWENECLKHYKSLVQRLPEPELKEFVSKCIEVRLVVKQWQ
jgi:hypothetical protein